MRVLGIDEAGRGCVLGDLVVCGFLVELETPLPGEASAPDHAALRAAAQDHAALRAAAQDHAALRAAARDHAALRAAARDHAALRAAGADDSKAMTPARRLEVREALRALGTADVRRVSARQIDGANLNQLEEAVVVELVRRWRPDVVILDALGHPNTLPYLRGRLAEAVGPDLRPEWVIEPKADANHAVVGAASIFAKTERDEALDRVRAEYGDVGSGYPSDPQTKRWLLEWSRSGRPWPPFVRTRWQTITALAQQSLLADGSA